MYPIQVPLWSLPNRLCLTVPAQKPAITFASSLEAPSSSKSKTQPLAQTPDPPIPEAPISYKGH